MTTRLESMDAELSRVYGELTAAQLECDRLSAELATLRGAMPDAQMLDSYATGIEWEGCDAGGLRQAAAAIRAQYNPATPTPPAAEAVTGGDGAAWRTEPPPRSDTYFVHRRGFIAPSTAYWADGFWGPRGWMSAGDRVDDVLIWAPITPPHGWREALAALDTPQEADHGD